MRGCACAQAHPGIYVQPAVRHDSLHGQSWARGSASVQAQVQARRPGRGLVPATPSLVHPPTCGTSAGCCSSAAGPRLRQDRGHGSSGRASSASKRLCRAADMRACMLALLHARCALQPSVLHALLVPHQPCSNCGFPRTAKPPPGRGTCRGQAGELGAIDTGDRRHALPRPVPQAKGQSVSGLKKQKAGGLSHWRTGGSSSCVAPPAAARTPRRPTCGGSQAGSRRRAQLELPPAPASWA